MRMSASVLQGISLPTRKDSFSIRRSWHSSACDGADEAADADDGLDGLDDVDLDLQVWHTNLAKTVILVALGFFCCVETNGAAEGHRTRDRGILTSVKYQAPKVSFEPTLTNYKYTVCAVVWTAASLLDCSRLGSCVTIYFRSRHTRVRWVSYEAIVLNMKSAFCSVLLFLLTSILTSTCSSFSFSWVSSVQASYTSLHGRVSTLL